MNAQREMADWAERMLWATSLLGVASLIVGGVGIYFVRQTLVANSAAVDQAKVANAIANEARLDQGRPFVFIENLGTNIAEVAHNSAGHLLWKFRLKNHGVTPAIIDFVYAQVLVGNDVSFDTFSVSERPRTQDFGYDFDRQTRWIIQIAPESPTRDMISLIPLNKEMVVDGRAFSDELEAHGFALAPVATNSVQEQLGLTAIGLVELRYFAWLYVVVYYQDVYGRRRITSGFYKQTNHGHTISQEKGTQVNYRT